MFETLFKYPRVVARHRSGPFAEARERFLNHCVSQGLAGATQLISGVPTRVGFVPKSRLLMTASEWVLEGLKFTLEGSIDWDYPISEGGTGGTGWGLLMALTFTF